MSAFFGENNAEPIRTILARQNDSIDEMASMLLDDTTMNTATAKSGQKPSLIKPTECLLSSTPGSDKSRPMLSQLLFNGNNAWATPSKPISNDLGMAPRTDPMHEENNSEIASLPPPVRRFSIHPRKNPTPPLPRRSSKRQTCYTLDEASSGTGNMDGACAVETQSYWQYDSESAGLYMSSEHAPRRSFDRAKQIDCGIKAAETASKTLSPDDKPKKGPVVPTKKRRLKGSKIIARMRSAIHERLHDSGLKKRACPIVKGCDEGDQLPEYDEERTAISEIEIRVNEGCNFSNPKIQTLTGCRNVKRKTAADDTKPPGSHLPVDDPFSDEIENSSSFRIPTEFEDRLKGDRISTQQRDKSTLSLLRSHSLRDILPRLYKSEEADSRMDVDFDALFSSSPLAQSTPRIRLEATFEEDGTKKLKNVLTNPDLVINAHASEQMDIDTPPHRKMSYRPVSTTDQRCSDQVDGSVKQASVQRMKKHHPSPSKDELENLEDALRHYSPLDKSCNENGRTNLARSFRDLQVTRTLTCKDGNARTKGVTHAGKLKGLGISESGTPSASITQPGKSKQSAIETGEIPMIPKPAVSPYMSKPRGQACISAAKPKGATGDDSALDVDELQWDETKYDIGMKTVQKIV